MELEYAYRQIAERLDRIDFPALYSGFRRYPFAVYNARQAYTAGGLIARPSEFIANTAVSFGGGYTAIWSLTEDGYDLDVLTAKIVHEMLHAHQRTVGDSRWADEREAFIWYRYDAVNLTARLEEAACMKECLTGDARGAFSRLMALRKARFEAFPYEYGYEARTEQMEGTAHYVELCALKQLDAGKAEVSRERTFAELLDPASYYPVRAVTYLSGAAMIACLKKYSDFDTDRLSDTPFAEAALDGVKPCALPECDARAGAVLAGARERMRDQVGQAIKKGRLVLEGDYRLIAWNVYDGVWDGHYAVLTYFIGYWEGGELPCTDEELFAGMKMLNGNFVAEVDESLRMTRVWEL